MQFTSSLTTFRMKAVGSSEMSVGTSLHSEISQKAAQILIKNMVRISTLTLVSVGMFCIYVISMNFVAVYVILS